MLLLVGDEDGNTLGTANIVGTKWRIAENGQMTNTSEVIVLITRAGRAMYTAFLDRDGNTLHAPGDIREKPFVGILDTLTFRQGKLRITFNVTQKASAKLEKPLSDMVPVASKDAGKQRKRSALVEWLFGLRAFLQLGPINAI